MAVSSACSCSRVFLDELPKLVEQQLGVVGVVQRRLARVDAAQLSPVDEVFELLIRGTPGSLGLVTDPVSRLGFVERERN